MVASGGEGGHVPLLPPLGSGTEDHYFMPDVLYIGRCRLLLTST